MSLSAKAVCLLGIGLCFSTMSLGFAGTDTVARTESICNLGMVKGEPQKSCDVPIPADCSVAKYPGYDEPWVDVSKAGGTSCQIDTQQTDWRTQITGTCQKCTTDQCSGRFSVMFNCTHNIPPANPQSPTR
jgi:hypothetical protein